MVYAGESQKNDVIYGYQSWTSKADGSRPLRRVNKRNGSWIVVQNAPILSRVLDSFLISVIDCPMCRPSFFWAATVMWTKWRERRSLRKSQDFSSEVCKTLSLPRELGWYCGSPVVATLDKCGQPTITHRRRTYVIPRILQMLGVDSWNITKEEAIAVIQTDPNRQG